MLRTCHVIEILDEPEGSIFVHVASDSGPSNACLHETT